MKAIDFPNMNERVFRSETARSRATFIAITMASLRDSIVRFDACNMVPLHLYTTPLSRCHVILKGPSCVSGSLSPIALAIAHWDTRPLCVYMRMVYAWNT